MKNDLTDLTILLPVRIDTIQRLENVICTSERLMHYFNVNVAIREADSYNNGILKSLLNGKIHYEFVEDKDPIFHRTKHFNQMMQYVTSSYVGIWDADVVIDKKAILESYTQLQNKTADVSLPYNGVCYDISEPIKHLYFKKKNIKLLLRHIGKMDLLYSHPLVGGAVLVNTKKYVEAGMENELHYGWGNDDFDRCYRFMGLGYKIHRVDTPLFHLSHPRGNNGNFKSQLSALISTRERNRFENSSKKEIEKYLNPDAEKVIE